MARHAASQKVFDYIEIFYNPIRLHTNNGMLSPIGYEIKQRQTNAADVYKSRRTSSRKKANPQWSMPSMLTRAMPSSAAML
ncbi:IS3 family transposase [Monaibacterium marinum]|uniref:IS3 family transposase n=1 Tax=Pontivivens marinum TaxID=1690039 RepID=UPI000BEF861E